MAARISGPFNTVDHLNWFLDQYWPHKTPIPGDPITTNNSHAFSLPPTFPRTRQALEYLCLIQQTVEYFIEVYPYSHDSICRNKWIYWGILRIQLYMELFRISPFRHGEWREARLRAYWDRFTKDEETDSASFIRLVCPWLIDDYRCPTSGRKGRPRARCRGFVCFLMADRLGC